jgi:hypothetical protein
VRYEAMEERAIVIARGAKSKEVLVAGKFDMFQAGRGGGGLTSAVLGTLSQKTSILMSPRFVCKVTDMVNG